ncbi:hypothetical protein DSO57_1039493, partial [Entomophthora muscae]
YVKAHFTAYRSEFPINSQKVLYLAEKLTDHYRDWFSSHSIRSPGILQNYDLFVSSLLSFSGEDKESYNLSSSWFAASDAEACSFYKIGLNKLLQEFSIHENLPDEYEPHIREVVKWNKRYLSSKTHPPFNLSPAVQLFVPGKVPLSLTPPPGIKPKAGGGFLLTAKKVLRRRNNNLCSYCGSNDDLLPAFPLSKRSPLVNKTSTLTLLSLRYTFKSLTVLVTIHGPLGKIKVLALLSLAPHLSSNPSLLTWRALHSASCVTPPPTYPSLSSLDSCS